MSHGALNDVLKNRSPERRPIWLMRQAGRYLPEYRAVRATAGSFLNLCYNPAAACEVTLQPLRRYDLDAAILFSDILVVPHAMGLSLDFVEGEGPKLQTVSNSRGVAELRLSGEQFDRVYETVALVRQSLAPGVGFIGFCGAPWTVASYMIEGGSSDRKRAVAIAVENPEWFSSMMSKLIASSIVYLLGQIKAGVDVVQIFDSWAGDVPVTARERVVVEPIAAIVAGVRAVHPGFPVIVFARGVGAGHNEVALKTGATVIGLEQNVVLRDVLTELTVHVAVQGNLAPDVLLRNEASIRSGVRTVLSGVPMARHIFNLGHGIVPQVAPEAVDILVDAVRRHDVEHA
jgi:uroporphyrinogen decarboxylase